MTKNKTKVDIWLERETAHKREALVRQGRIRLRRKNASRYFDNKDTLTVNTLEAVYGQESSFGIQLRNRGMKGAAGEFHFEKATAGGHWISKDDHDIFICD